MISHSKKSKTMDHSTMHVMAVGTLCLGCSHRNEEEILCWAVHLPIFGYENSRLRKRSSRSDHLSFGSGKTRFTEKQELQPLGHCTAPWWADKNQGEITNDPSLSWGNHQATIIGNDCDDWGDCEWLMGLVSGWVFNQSLTSAICFVLQSWYANGSLGWLMEDCLMLRMKHYMKAKRLGRLVHF